MHTSTHSHHPHYHGMPGYPYPQPHGFCHSCCHPMSQCACGCRECRKEAKELLVEARRAGSGMQRLDDLQRFEEMTGKTPESVRSSTTDTEAEAVRLDAQMMSGLAGVNPEILEAMAKRGNLGRAFIGGGCCVHLSIEYTSMAENALVGVVVVDAERTSLSWSKSEIQPGYYIKEDIISTNPGATMAVLVSNATARVRWCEVFSC